ncbi:MAG: universal stress protein [Thermodesulfovibrionales bacterium]|jgi:nucleotide-binding universal stress UspA family protein
MRIGKGVKKVLVAIDGSESGMNALRQSFRLAAQEKSWITVVCVVPPYQGDLDMVGVGNVMEAMRKPCEDALKEAESMAKAEGALIKTVCEEGEAYERIIDLAEAENAELIIMGRRGLSGLERALMGSVTARVIGHSRRDVLVVPRTATEVSWKRILLAIDGSKYSAAAIERAIDFAEGYGGELRIISVVDLPTEFYGEAPNVVDDIIGKAKGYVEAAQKKAGERGVRAETFVREGETHQVIADMAKELQADTIVMGSHGRTGLKRLLMGSTTEKVIGYASCPVLVVRA